MIKSITVKNNSLGEGNTKVIELGSPETSGIWVREITGIGPGKANINVTDFASSDGGIFNSARSTTRNIVLSLGFVPYSVGEGPDRKSYSVEDVRRDLYKWFAKKKWIEIIINLEQTVENYNAPASIRRINLGCVGWVESNEPNIFSKDETAQISIICPDPNMYLYDNKGNLVSEGISFSATADGFDIPMAFIETQDEEFDEDKIYYEYNVLTYEYEITEDIRKLSGKTYYEEYDITELLKYIEHYVWNETTQEWEDITSSDTYMQEVCHEGYENLVDEEYFLTEDTEPKAGKEYFYKINDEYIPLDDVFVVTSDTEMNDSKTYYEMVSGEFVITQDETFQEGKTYYELVGFSQLTTLPAGTYEYQSNTELAQLITIATKEMDYDAEIEVGVNITIYISGEVTGLKLYKIDPKDRYHFETIEINDEAISLAAGSGLSAGDEIKICTTKGQKEAWLIREAREINIMNALGKNPDWFQMDQGDNEFSYGATDGSEHVSMNIDHIKAYEGV